MQARFALFIAGIAAGVVLLDAATSHAATTYYIDEATDYTGNGCSNNDLNTVTASLQSLMSDRGWTGERWVNADAWPQDISESCSTNYGSGGIDSTYGDTKSLVVFAGHGSSTSLQYGQQVSNRCTAEFAAHMRLGSMDGDTAAVGMWLACDTLHVPSLAANANHQWLRQQLGWQNTIGIGDDEPATFFFLTGSFGLLPAQTNADAWLNTMDGDGRQPIVVSYGSTSTGCWTVHDNAKLGDNSYTSERPSNPTCGQGQPSFFYCYETI